MFSFAWGKKRNTTVSDASIRYETAVKEKQVYSLSFEVAQHLEQASNAGFLAAVNEACKNIGRELMLMRQVQLLDQAILAPRKSGSV